MMQTEDHPPATSPAPAPTLEEAIREKLESAPLPLKLAEVKKGLTKPKKLKPKDFEGEIRRQLDEAARVGRAFIYPSGPKGAERFWSRDEQHAIREKALETAEASPSTIADLKKKAAPTSKADAGFIETVIRELIAEGKLFEHPPKTAKGQPLFGTAPPPPPLPALETAKYKSDVNKLVTAAQKLLEKARVPVEDLIRLLTDRLNAPEPAPSHSPAHANNASHTAHHATHTAHHGTHTQDHATHAADHGTHTSHHGAHAPQHTPTSHPEVSARHAVAEPAVPHHHAAPAAHAEPATGELESRILAEVEKAPVLSLADLRHKMPAAHRGKDFDAAVIKLFDDRKVVLAADANPVRFSPEELQGYVHDEDGTVFTTISRS